MIPLGLFLLACAAIYVGVLQAAFSALMRLSLRLLAERTGRTAQLGRYLEEPLLLFVPARLLMGLIIGLAALLIARVTGVHGAGAIVLLILGTSIFILAFEHVIPLLIVRHDPERVLNLLLPSFTTAVRPIQPLLRGLSQLIGVERVRGLPIQGLPEEPEEDTPPSAGTEADAGDAATPERRDERQLLRSIVNFGDTLVREVMTPRPDIVAIRADASTRELKALFREQEYSRIPVYFENLDNIVGVVFVKDLIQHGEDKPIAQLMRPPYFVPETKPVSDLLKEFQRKRVQGAIVVDEYGGTAGLVTLEDLLEEIVGEIRDEYDDESEPVVDEGNGSFVFSGKVDIDDVADRLKIQIQREGFETVGGYLLSHLGRVPAVGETFEVDDLSVEVLDAERRRVNKVRMRRLAQPALESPAEQ